jgi:hypothetical protein
MLSNEYIDMMAGGNEEAARKTFLRDSVQFKYAKAQHYVDWLASKLIGEGVTELGRSS